MLKKLLESLEPKDKNLFKKKTSYLTIKIKNEISEFSSEHYETEV